jgi:predicted DNA-binding protein (UPF0251 family)
MTVSLTLRARFAAHVERRPSGCLMPRGPSTMHISVGPGQTLTLGRAAWFLAYGELPVARLRRTCGCHGCAEVGHLEPCPPVRGYIPRRTQLSHDEKTEALRLRYAERRTLARIAAVFGVSVNTIHRLVSSSPPPARTPQEVDPRAPAPPAEPRTTPGPPHGHHHV